MASNTTSIKDYLMLIILSIIWGSGFFCNHIALISFTPFAIACLRAIIGTITLCLLIPIVAKEKTNTLKAYAYWKKIILIAVFEAVLPFFLIAWGQQHISSALATIIMSMTAVFTLLLVLLFVRHEKVSAAKGIAIILGFVAIIILMFPRLQHQHLGPHFQTLGKIAVLLAALSFAISLVMIRKLPDGFEPVRTARNILFSAAIMLLLILVSTHAPLLLAPISSASLMSVLFLGMFSTGVAYVLYVLLIYRVGATFASFSNYLIPFVGIFLGLLFLKEKLNWATCVSLALLIIAMFVSEMPYIKRLNAKRDRPSE